MGNTSAASPSRPSSVDSGSRPDLAKRARFASANAVQLYVPASDEPEKFVRGLGGLLLGEQSSHQQAN
jgi:hypothetical protein